MPRFVILEHDHPRLHWDLLLEDGDHLRGWRLAEPPRTGGTIAAEAMPDHRVFYLAGAFADRSHCNTSTGRNGSRCSAPR